MSKKGVHHRELQRLFEAFLESGGFDDLKAYLISHSNLPSPRANLELAEAFGDLMETLVAKESRVGWDLCDMLVHYPVDDLPANHPEEFLPFCGAIGLGGVASSNQEFLNPSIAALKELASSSRWRTREAVRMALQRLLRRQYPETGQELEGWIGEGDLLQIRAVAAAIADPTLLKEKSRAVWALNLHQQIMERVKEVQDRTSDAFRVLRKALGYTVSVVVSAIPEDGFQWMTDELKNDDPDIKWILRENLKKKRLLRAFPQEVDRIRELIE